MPNYTNTSFLSGAFAPTSSIANYVAPTASLASTGGSTLGSLLGGGASGMSGKQYLAAQAIPALASLFGMFYGGRSQSKALSSQERLTREQMALQERLLEADRLAKEKYNEQMAEQFRIQQQNAALERELARQQYERSQGFTEQMYNDRKAAARPYYDYVWKYLNTPLK